MTVFPSIAAAALRNRNYSAFATYVILQASDRLATDGSGYLRRSAAVKLIEVSRHVQRRQATRLMQEGNGTFWDLGCEHVRLFGVYRIASRFGLETGGRPHKIPIEHFGLGLASIRSTLMTCLYRTDDKGQPMSRRTVAQWTGIAPSTQRRHDARFGYSQRVGEVIHVRVARCIRENVATVAKYLKNWGFFQGAAGDLIRRHPDVRTAASHQIDTRRKGSRLNRKLGGDRPATKACGQRSPRSFFPGWRGGEVAWVKSKNALGKQDAAIVPIHPMLNYSLGERRTDRGKKQWVALCGMDGQN